MGRACYINSVFTAAKQTGADGSPEAGQFGRFQLQELVNTGGMAEIWLATDGDGKVFALRRLLEKLRFNITARRDFFRGCEILSKIDDHGGIIGYYEHGTIKLRPYCLMEYIEAANLKDLYARQDPVLVENVAQILIDMSVGLEHVHESGFMHLDFKPENVLVTGNAAVRLVDFDLARQIPEQPTKFSGKNPGTPSYMAPEQLQGLPISHRVDIFSFGVSAYELLTFQKPFPGESPAEILRRQLDRTEFIAPRQHNPDIPPTVEKIILRCLEKEPERRYPFIGVMVRELQAALYV